MTDTLKTENTTFKPFKVRADDRKAITNHVRRLLRMNGGYRLEIKRWWVDIDGERFSTFNIGFGDQVDIDDSYNYRYNWNEFSAHSVNDIGLQHPSVTLDICIAVRRGFGDYAEYEPVDWIYPTFLEGKLDFIGECGD